MVAWEDRLELDVRYVEERSLRLDLLILAKTVGMVLRREGISSPGHETMAPFEGSTGPSGPCAGPEG
jgi:sugar transferase EpsL